PAHLLDRWIRPYARRRAFGVDRAGRDAVDADAHRAPFACVRNGQVDDAGFGRTVRKHKGRPMHARGRGDIDDRAGALLLDELAGRPPRAEENAPEIDFDHPAASPWR